MRVIIYLTGFLRWLKLDVLMSAALGFLLVAQLYRFDFTPITSPQYAGDSFEVAIIARDPYGGIYDYNRPAFLSTSRGASYIYPNVIGPFRNGVWNGKVMVTIADSLQIRCTDDSVRVTSSSNVFQVVSGPPRRFVTVLPGQQLSPGTREGRLGLPNSQSAGDSFYFTVYLTDVWCNPVRFRTDSVYFNASDSFAVLPAGGEIQDGSGRFNAIFRRAGVHHLYCLPATGQPFVPDTSSLFDVRPGAFERLLLILPGEVPAPGDTATLAWMTPGKSGTPFAQYVREPFPVSVYPCDRCWNIVGASGLRIKLNSEFPIEFFPSETTLVDSANFLVQFNMSEPNQNLWVSDVAGGNGSYPTRLDIKARGKSLEITAPDTVVAGETAYIRVVVRDANQQPITAAVCRFSVVKGNGDILDEALLTDTSGVAVARFLCTRARFAEFDTLRIVSGAAESLVGIYIDIPDSAVMLGKIVAFPNPFGFNRDAAEIVYYLTRSGGVDVRIFDPFGNEVVSWHFSAGEPGARAGINRVMWNGRNRYGRRVASGVYVVQVLGQLHTGTVFRSTYRLGVAW